MASDKGDYIQQEHAQRAGGKKRHCRRFWWVYLAVFLVIVVLVVCLILLVAIPKIAQQKLDAAELHVDSISILNVQTNEYDLGINSSITSDGSVHATIHGFIGDMYLEDLLPHTPFTSVAFPDTRSDPLVVVNVTQHIKVANMAAFTTFNTWLLNNETLRVTFRGDTTVRVDGIARDYPVTFSKTVTLKGLNDFKGLNVTSSSISLQPDAQGDNFHGFADVPNASILTINIGNASFHNYLNGAEIGTVFMDNLTLYPGINNATMRANISQAPVLTALGQKPYCQDGILPFVLNGKDVVNFGQHIPYYADSLATANQTIGINIGAALKQDLNVTVSCAA